MYYNLDMNQFTAICLDTFILFLGYWLFVAITAKTSKAIGKFTFYSVQHSNDAGRISKSINDLRKRLAMIKNYHQDVKNSPSTQKESKIGSGNLSQHSQNRDRKDKVLTNPEPQQVNLPAIEEPFEPENSHSGYISGNLEEISFRMMAPSQKNNMFCHENKNETQIDLVQLVQNREGEKVDVAGRQIEREMLNEGFFEQRIEEDGKMCSEFEDMKQRKSEFQLKLKEPILSHHEDSADQSLLQQIHLYKTENQHLRNEIQQARSQIKRLEECESEQKRQISHLKKELQRVSKANLKGNVMYLRSKKLNIQPSTNENVNTQVYENEAKDKTIKTHKKAKVFIEGHQDKANQEKPIFNCHPSPFCTLQAQKIMEKSQPKKGFRFLSDCCFVTSQDKAFLYKELQTLLSGSLKTQKFYNSKQSSQKNPHAFIDNIGNILLAIELENGKIIGGYSQCAFTPITPNSVSQNVAFLFDISNMKSFKNRNGKNSTNYSPNNVTWGMDELTISFERPNYLMTHFGSSEGIFWDGEYRREDLVGVDRDWVSINQYEIFRVTSE